MRPKWLRFVLSVAPTLSLTVVGTAAIADHLLSRPAPAGGLPALPTANPSPVIIRAGTCYLETEPNGSAYICPVSGNVRSFPPMFNAPIATPVPASANNPPGGYMPGGAL